MSKKEKGVKSTFDWCSQFRKMMKFFNMHNDAFQRSRLFAILCKSLIIR